MQEEAPPPPELDLAQFGDTPDDQAQLFATLHRELRLIAERIGRGQANHTLPPTALLNESWIRLFGDGSNPPRNRDQLLGTAAMAMRQVLVDHSRRMRARKRGGDVVHVQLDEVVHSLERQSGTDLESLDEALRQLGEASQTAGRYVTLRYFGNRTNAEVSRLLGLSPRSGNRLWEFARSWLRHRLRS